MLDDRAKAAGPAAASQPPRPAAAPGAKPDWALSRREAEGARRAGEGLPRPRRRWPWIALLLLGALGAAGWLLRDDPRLAPAIARVQSLAGGEGEAPAGAAPGGAAAPAEAGAEEGEPLPAARVGAGEWARVEPQDLRRTVRVIGTLAPIQSIDLAAGTSGIVESVAAEEGDPVTAGQVLVQVDAVRLSIDLDLARSNAAATRAQLSLGEGQLGRAQTLVDRGVSTASVLEEAQANVDALRANLSAQEDQIAAAAVALEDATVLAPFDGVVAARSIEPGAYAQTGAALVTVVDLRRMEMLASAPVSAGPEIQGGQQVEVVVDGAGGRTFPGEVARVAPVAEEGTRSLTVYVTLDNEDGILLGGMFATAEIVVAEAPGAVALPGPALREDEAGPHVLVIEDGAVRRRDVEPGDAWGGDLVEIRSGLEPGEAVITAALPDLEAGRAVEVEEG